MGPLARALVVLAAMTALGAGALGEPGAAAAANAQVSAGVAAPADVEPEPSPGAEPEPPEGSDDAEPSPEPSPEPTPPAEDDGGDGDGDQPEPGDAGEECGFGDVECYVVEAFRSWIAETVADFVNSQMMAAAVGLMLMTPPSSGIQTVWSTALAVVNTGFVLVVTLAGVLVMGHQTVQTSTGIKEVAPRLALAFIAANASWFVTQQLGRVGNGISAAVLGESADADNVTNTFARFLEEPVGEGLITIQLMLLGSVAGLIFVFTVIVRVMLWILLTAAAPLALAAHALPQTEGLARLWWRAIGALLIAQIAQALTLRAAMSLFLEREGLDELNPVGTASSVIDLGVLIACLYVLIRIPFWAGKRVFGYQSSPLVKGAKLAVGLLVFKGLGLGKALAGKTAANAAGKARTAKTARTATTAPQSAPKSPQSPRWVQPELPGRRPRTARGHHQPTLPGIDRQIDPAAQQRLRERRRWVQPPLPSGQPSSPPWHRQEPLPGMENTPRARQEAIPDLKVPPQTRTEPLFPVTEDMRRPPLHRVPRAEPHGTPHERHRQPLPPLPPRSAQPSGDTAVPRSPARPRPRRRPPRPDRGGRS